MSAANHADPPEPHPQVRIGARIEPVFYESFLAGFRDPLHADILRLMGDLLHTVTIETFYWLGEECRGAAGMRQDVVAAAADLEHIAEFLRGLPRGVCEVQEAPGQIILGCEADEWARRVRRIAGEMRAAAEEPS